MLMHTSALMVMAAAGLREAPPAHRAAAVCTTQTAGLTQLLLVTTAGICYFLTPRTHVRAEEIQAQIQDGILQMTFLLFPERSQIVSCSYLAV